uniref:PDZ domain-containing protein n=1 Tax=Globisporangium ultimum (strain ATCC 200006 / CBS 805.95 / DAOM BR144) TaxID=431595 RepID=K3W9Y7_GLOUD
MRGPAKDQLNASGLAADEMVGKRVRKSFGSRFFWGSIVGCYHVADALFYKISFDDGDVDIVAAVEVQEDIKQEDRLQQSAQQEAEDAEDVEDDERAPRSYRDEMRRSTHLKRRREETTTAVATATAVATTAHAERESDSVDVTLWGHRLFTSIVTNKKTTSIADFVKQDDGVSIGELEATGKVKRGDIITHIDGRPVSGMNSMTITHMIRTSKRPIVMTFQRKHDRRKAPHEREDAARFQQSMQHSAASETQESSSNGGIPSATTHVPVEQDVAKLEAPPATQPVHGDGQQEYNAANHIQLQQTASQDPCAESNRDDVLRVNLNFSQYVPANKRQHTATTESTLSTSQSSSFMNTSSTMGTTAFVRSTTQADSVSLLNRYYPNNAPPSFVTPPPYIPPPHQVPLDPRFMVVNQEAQRPSSAPLIPDEPEEQHNVSPSFDDNASYHDAGDVMPKNAVETGTSMLSASSEHTTTSEQMSFLSPSKGSFVSSLPSTDDNSDAAAFAQPSSSSYWTNEFDGCAVVQIRRNRLFVTLGSLGSHVCITSFVHGPNGERGEIEVSGKVFLGDIIVAVNGMAVASGTSPTQVAHLVIALDRPFEIAFQRASWDTLEGK